MRRELAREALRRAQAMGLPDDERVAWEGLGIILEQQRDFQGAQVCYEKALEIIEIGRKELTAGTYRVGFFASRYGPYQRLVELFFTLISRSKLGQSVNELALAVSSTRYRTLTCALPALYLPICV
jgi:tetratricopeptide (TPR) repeat protein